MKKVICDGIEFNSITSACEHFGLSYNKLNSKLGNNKETNWYRL